MRGLHCLDDDDIYVKSSRLSFFTTASRVFLVPERDGPSMPTRGFGPTIAAIIAVLAGIGTLDRRIFVALEVTDVGRLNSNGANDRESDPLDGRKKRHQLECGAAMRNDSSEADSTCSKRRPGGGACLVEKHFPSMPLPKQPRGSCGQLRSEGLWRYLKLFGDWNESQCNVPSVTDSLRGPGLTSYQYNATVARGEATQ